MTIQRNANISQILQGLLSNRPDTDHAVNAKRAQLRGLSPLANSQTSDINTAAASVHISRQGRSQQAVYADTYTDYDENYPYDNSYADDEAVHNDTVFGISDFPDMEGSPFAKLSMLLQRALRVPVDNAWHNGVRTDARRDLIPEAHEMVMELISAFSAQPPLSLQEQDRHINRFLERSATFLQSNFPGGNTEKIDSVITRLTDLVSPFMSTGSGVSPYLSTWGLRKNL